MDDKQKLISSLTGIFCDEEPSVKLLFNDTTFSVEVEVSDEKKDETWHDLVDCEGPAQISISHFDVQAVTFPENTVLRLEVVDAKTVEEFWCVNGIGETVKEG